MALTKVHNRMLSGSYANVLDFGAIGDGVTDDTAAVKAALASGEKTIYFPVGTYNVQEACTVTAGISLVGENQRNTIIKCKADVAGDIVFFTLNGGDTSVQNMTIQGTSSSSGTGLLWSNGVYVFSGNAFMSDVTVTTLKIAVDITSWYRFEINRCRIQGSNTGFQIAPLTDGGDNGYLNGIYLNNCYFYDNDTYDVYVNPAIRASNLSFTNCIFDPGATTYQVYLNTGNVVEFNNCYWETSTATRSLYIEDSSAVFINGGYGLGTGIELTNSQSEITVRDLRTGSSHVLIAPFALNTVHLENVTLPSSGNSLPTTYARTYISDSAINGTNTLFKAPTIEVGEGDAVLDWKGFSKTITATVNANTTSALIADESIGGHWQAGAVGYASFSDGYFPGLILTVTCASTGSNLYFSVLATNTTVSNITITSKVLNVVLQRMSAYETL